MNNFKKQKAKLDRRLRFLVRVSEFKAFVQGRCIRHLNEKLIKAAISYKLMKESE